VCTLHCTAASYVRRTRILIACSLVFVLSLVWNRSPDKVDETAKRAVEEKLGDRLKPFKDMKEFIQSINKPRYVPL